MQIEYDFIKCACTINSCPVHYKCCFLPTECHPGLDGTVKILFVGQGGGKDERRLGRPFIGKAGKRLRQQILYARKRLGKHFGVAFSNTIRDNPQDNRIPTDEELTFCLPFLYTDIKTLMARGLRVVMPLGNAAKSALISSGAEGITKIHGKVFHVKNATFGSIAMIPTYHPSYVMRNISKFDDKEPGSLDLAVIEDIIRAHDIDADDDVVVDLEETERLDAQI